MKANELAPGLIAAAKRYLEALLDLGITAPGR
jgi:hypothetical protein